MCEKWLNDPAAFLQDMGPKPDGYTLDRLDNDGPYAPENCRWATITDQARNKSNLRKDESGRILILDVVARGMDPRAYNWRMRHGWTHEEACSVPIGVRRKRYYSTQ